MQQKKIVGGNPLAGIQQTGALAGGWPAFSKNDRPAANFRLNGTGRGRTTTIPFFKKGGKVKKTGLAYVHKGERVLTKEQATNKKYDRITSRVKKKMGSK
jgi:hypothetical protein